MSDDQAGALLEGFLFVAERPLEAAELAQVAGLPKRQVEAALRSLADELEERRRGIRLQQQADAWQLVTAPELGPRLGAYVGRREPALSPAALEALAVVAYRQPCTKADVEHVRGVDSDYVLRSLMHRRLVAEVGRRDAPGRPILYGTTFAFLERFGLTSLDQLPPLAGAATGTVLDGTGSGGAEEARSDGA